MHRLSLVLTLSLAASACSSGPAAPAETARPMATEAEAPATAEHHAVTTETLEPFTCGTIARLHTLGGIYTASQPSPDDFAQAKKGGIRTVVNMRHESEITAFDEPAVIADLGLEYISLPWNGPEELTDTVIDRSREIFETAPRPMLVHCGSANRVGAVWLAWRVLDGGLPYDQALAEAKEVGLKTPAYLELATDYIRRHGGKT